MHETSVSLITELTAHGMTTLRPKYMPVRQVYGTGRCRLLSADPSFVIIENNVDYAPATMQETSWKVGEDEREISNLYDHDYESFQPPGVQTPDESSEWRYQVPYVARGLPVHAHRGDHTSERNIVFWKLRFSPGKAGIF